MSDKRTASQRIEDLERAVMSLYQGFNNMSRDLGLIKNQLKFMSGSITAIVELATAGKPITEAGVDEIMRQKELDELKSKVQELVDKGFLVKTETTPEDTKVAFVVGSECEPDAADGTAGKVMHARLQFTLGSLDQEIQDKFKGSKVGDTVSFKEGALVFKIQEMYRIVNPTPAEAAPAAAEAAPAPVETESSAPITTFAPADSAPAATQSSSDASTAQADSSAAPASQSAGN